MSVAPGLSLPAPAQGKPGSAAHPSASTQPTPPSASASGQVVPEQAQTSSTLSSGARVQRPSFNSPAPQVKPRHYRDEQPQGWFNPLDDFQHKVQQHTQQMLQATGMLPPRDQVEADLFAAQAQVSQLQKKVKQGQQEAHKLAQDQRRERAPVCNSGWHLDDKAQKVGCLVDENLYTQCENRHLVQSSGASQEFGTSSASCAHMQRRCGNEAMCIPLVENCQHLPNAFSFHVHRAMLLTDPAVPSVMCLSAAAPGNQSAAGGKQACSCSPGSCRQSNMQRPKVANNCGSARQPACRSAQRGQQAARGAEECTGGQQQWR